MKAMEKAKKNNWIVMSHAEDKTFSKIDMRIAEDLMTINKLAVATCYWPLYEVVDGVYKITYKPAKKLPIEEFLKPQKRFKHMFKPGNEWMIEEFQKEVDNRWQELLDLEEMTNKTNE